MNKKSLLIALGLLSSLAGKAQMALPYTTGFDNATEISGWQNYRAGITTERHWDLNSDFAILPSSQCPSAPDCIIHDYPEGDSLTDDWLISPSLDVSMGANVSLKISVFNMSINTSGGSMAAGDTIEMYLLAGNANPSKATKTLLTTFQPNGKGVPLDTFQNIGSIPIAATSGEAHLAFRYTCINDWFQIAIDNIHVTSGSGTGVHNVATSQQALAVYPNPAKDIIYWNTTAGTSSAKAIVYNVTGQVMATLPAGKGNYDIRGLAPGIYFLKIGTGLSQFTKK